jgi:uncharacterized membrane protein YidH (DUF202 family)
MRECARYTLFASFDRAVLFSKKMQVLRTLQHFATFHNAMFSQGLRRSRGPFCSTQKHQHRRLFDQAWKEITSHRQVVENSGSIARDVLAAERTFLAWSRTGLGFVGAGSALFATFHRYASIEDCSSDGTRLMQRKHIYPASALLVVNGAFLLTFATRRYLRTVHYLMQDKFVLDTRGTMMAIVVTASSTLTSLGLVLRAEIQSGIVDTTTVIHQGKTAKRGEGK